jgi:hypothetical protein
MGYTPTDIEVDANGPYNSTVSFTLNRGHEIRLSSLDMSYRPF